MELCRPDMHSALLAVRAAGYDPVSIVQIRDEEHECVPGDWATCMPIAEVSGTRRYTDLQLKVTRALLAGYRPVFL